jgi:hypothetical protein
MGGMLPLPGNGSGVAAAEEALPGVGRPRERRRGDAVRVRRADGEWLAFEVTGTARYAKAAFPTDAVSGPVTGPVLRLITCGGDFDRSSGHYLDNVVVTARPAANGVESAIADDRSGSDRRMRRSANRRSAGQPPA